MFGKIVVPLDGSDLAEQIMPYAAGLAGALGVPVQLLHVVEPALLDAANTDELSQPVYLDQVLQHQEDWARSYLLGVAELLRADGAQVDVNVARGLPEEAIVEAAQSGGRHLVAMATHGRTGLERLVMGSVADKVLHRCTVPLLLFRPKPGRTCPARLPRTIIVPLDGSDLGDQALPLAGVLARGLGGRVLLVHVVSVYALALPVAIGGAGQQMVSGAEAETRMYLDQRVHSLCLERVDADSLLLEGDVAPELIKLASSTPDTLVVMSTHGRSGIPRMVLGSVADEVVRRSGVPVLVVRPVHR